MRQRRRLDYLFWWGFCGLILVGVVHLVCSTVPGWLSAREPVEWTLLIVLLSVSFVLASLRIGRVIQDVIRDRNANQRR